MAFTTDKPAYKEFLPIMYTIHRYTIGHPRHKAYNDIFGWSLEMCYCVGYTVLKNTCVGENRKKKKRRKRASQKEEGV